MSEDQNLILVQGLIENFDAKTTRTVVTICNNRLDSLGEPIAPPQRAKGVRSHGGYKPKDFNAKGYPNLIAWHGKHVDDTWNEINNWLGNNTSNPFKTFRHIDLESFDFHKAQNKSFCIMSIGGRYKKKGYAWGFKVDGVANTTLNDVEIPDFMNMSGWQNAHTNRSPFFNDGSPDISNAQSTIFLNLQECIDDIKMYVHGYTQ